LATNGAALVELRRALYKVQNEARPVKLRRAFAALAPPLTTLSRPDNRS
jgi:hypothetical protein